MLLDSDILIDYLRGYEKTVSWLHSVEETISVSGYSYFELIGGCRSYRDLQQIEKFLSAFEILWLNENNIHKALSVFKNNKFKVGIGFIDSLIGQTSVTYKKSLYTFNLKHYKAFSGIKVIKPFEK